VAGETLKDEWRALDHRTRWRLRQAAWKGTELDDPTETALVGYFAREQLRLFRALVVMYALVIAGVTASLVLNLSRGGSGLAFVYAGILVIDTAAFAMTLHWRRRYLRAVERGERAAAEAR
jgi:hypothetical protein